MVERELEQIGQVVSSILPELPIVKEFGKIIDCLWYAVNKTVRKATPQLWRGLPGRSDRRWYVG